MPHHISPTVRWEPSLPRSPTILQSWKSKTKGLSPVSLINSLPYSLPEVPTCEICRAPLLATYHMLIHVIFGPAQVVYSSWSGGFRLLMVVDNFPGGLVAVEKVLGYCVYDCCIRGHYRRIDPTPADNCSLCCFHGAEAEIGLCSDVRSALVTGPRDQLLLHHRRGVNSSASDFLFLRFDRFSLPGL